MIRSKEILIASTLTIAAATTVVACEKSNKNPPLASTPTAVERSSDEIKGLTAGEFKARLDQAMQEAINQNIGYLHDLSDLFYALPDDKKFSVPVIDVPFIVDGKPAFIRITKGDIGGNDPEKIAVLIDHYDGTLNIQLTVTPGNDIPYWNLHPTETGQGLTDQERGQVIAEIEQAIELGKQYSKYEVPISEEVINTEEFNQRFDAILEKANAQNIGEKSDYRNDDGRTFYYVDPKSALLIEVTVRKGIRHTETGGRDFPDSSARTIDIRYFSAPIKDWNISTWGNTPPTELHGEIINREIPTFKPRRLTGSETATVLKIAEEAINLALDYNPFYPEKPELTPTPTPLPPISSRDIQRA